MNYIIMITEDIVNGVQVDLHKCGNQYTVSFSKIPDGETDTDFTIRRFDSLDDALVIYSKFTDAFARGMYDYEQRKSWLRL